MEIILDLEKVQIFTSATKDTYAQRFDTKIPNFVQYCVYFGEYELKDSEIQGMKATCADYNMTHLCKFNSGVQILVYWTENNVISSQKFDEYQFNKPHFVLSGNNFQYNQKPFE